MRNYFSYVLFFWVHILNAQTGPGGVSDTSGTSDLVIWFKPDKGLVTSGGITDTVLSWKNSANYTAHNVTATPGSKPIRKSSAVNGMSVVAYNGSSSMLSTTGTLTSTNFPTNTASWFILSKANNTSQNSNVFQSYPFCSNRFSCHIPWANIAYADMGNCCGSTARLNATTSNFLTNAIWSYVRNAANGGQLYSNGSLIANQTGSSTYSAQTNSAFNIGGKDNGAACTSGASSANGFDGDIGEIIIFKTRIDSAKRYIIENYLSSKYNVSLTTKDLYAGDTPANGDMDLGVVGIGNESGGTQVISRSDYGLTLDGGTMSTFASGDYILAGTNNVNTSYNQYFNCDIVNASGLNTRWERVFYLDVTKSSGTLTISLTFDFRTAPQAGTYSLIYRTSDTPGSTWTVASAAGSVSGNTVVFSGINFTSASDGFYTVAYTVASASSTFGSPGGVSSGLGLWLKADAGVNGISNARFWNDYSGNCMYGLGTNSPVLTINASNYNPGIQLNGSGNSNTASTISSYFSLPSGFSSFSGAASFVAASPTVTRNNARFFDFANGSANNNIYFARSARTTQLLYEVYNASTGTQKTASAGSLDNSSIQLFSSNQLASTNAVTLQKNGLNYSLGAAQAIQNVSRTKNYIGLSNTNTDSTFGGLISEIILYNRELTTTEQQKINTYLSLKYGLTLDRTGMSSTYLNTNGDVIYTDGGTYWNNIIGIGRDDVESFYQKQSKTTTDTVRLYRSLNLTNQLNTSTISNSPSYLVMGSDGARMCSVFSSATHNEKPSGIITRLAREWKIYNTNFSDSYSLDIKLNSCALPSTVTIAHLRLLVDDDADFSNATAIASGTSGITITYTNPVITISGLSTSIIPLNGLRYITIGSTNSITPLPVELVSFHADCKDEAIELKWQTASEINNHYFSIERSENGSGWKTIGTKPGFGNSTQMNSYSFYDTLKSMQICYYRLKQIDFDGCSKYSAIISNNCMTEFGEFTLSPNPTTGDVIIGNTGTFSEIRVTDVTGRLIMRTTQSSNLINLSAFDKGMYYIIIHNTHGIFSKKIILE